MSIGGRVTTLFALAIRSLLWRRWVSLGLLACSAVAFATAGTGPLWANAAEDSLISRSVASVPPDQRSVVVTARGNDAVKGIQVIPALAVQAARDAARMPVGLDESFSRTRLSVMTASRETVTRGTPPVRVLSPLAWRPGACEHLHLLVGHCPGSSNELLVSRRTAHVLDVRAGQTVHVPTLGDEPPQAGSGVLFPTAFRIAGIYRVPNRNNDFWTSTDEFGFAPAGASLRQPLPARGDALFGTRALMLALAARPVEVHAIRVLQVRHPRGDRVDPVERQLSAWVERLRLSEGSVSLDDAALVLMQDVHVQRDAVRLACYLLGLQLLVLVWYVLFLMTSAIADTRSQDLALAKLRGLSAGTVTVFGALEAAVLVLLAVPLGLLLAVSVTRTAVSGYLPGDVPLRPDRWLVVALALALAGSLLAVVLGLRRAVRQPVLQQLVRASPATAIRRLMMAEIVVVTAAVAALWQVRARGGDSDLSGLALLAPGLAAIAVAVIVGRGLQQLARPWAWRTRHRTNVSSFLAARQIGRRSGGSRAAMIATIAVSLSTFSVGTWALTERQRDGQAALDVGAATVYSVRAPSAPQLVSTVRKLDPSGTHLAAAAQLPSDDPNARLLAVDATRLAEVSSWQPGWSTRGVRSIAHRLRPKTAESLMVQGRSMTLDVEVSLAPESPAVAVTGVVADHDGRESPISFGRVLPTRQTVTARIRQCAAGCRVISLGLVRLPGQISTLTGSATFRALSVDGRPVTEPFDPRSWRAARVDESLPVSAPLVTVTGSDGGLRMAFNDSPSQSPGIVRADVPAALPVVTTSSTRHDPVGRDRLVLSPGLDGFTTVSRVVATATVLPRQGGVGSLADLELAYRANPDLLPSVRLQVWASDSAPPPERLVPRLNRAGLRVTAAHTVEERLGGLGREGPALALALLLGVTVAALLLAVLAVTAYALAQGRRRAYELAALRTAGVPDRALRGASMLEYAVQLLGGAMVGALSGAGTTWLVGESVMAIGRAGAVAPVSTDPAWTALGLSAGGAVLVFAVVGVVCARATLRFAEADLLREAPA